MIWHTEIIPVLEFKNKAARGPHHLKCAQHACSPSWVFKGLQHIHFSVSLITSCPGQDSLPASHLDSAKLIIPLPVGAIMIKVNKYSCKNQTGHTQC